MADLAYAFKWSKADLLAEHWDELIRWHAEVRRIYRSQGGAHD
ncbi:MAG: hypothetical protein Q4G22_04845 [Paracoccus sp. (in: a-proteobacteria)]|nr:hypothetical protein [Paracoccus sp. (in: a-proteobacteria)]MDO5631147.1 hypothetical protein [Paracoccus sp. (in: a-proteobacteria)]